MLFVFGLWRLFALRFETGDVYPFYSTLRSDALGAKAFYAALETLPYGPRVERNFRGLARLLRPPALKLLGRQQPATTPQNLIGAGDTVFLLGTNPRTWPFAFTKDEATELEAAARRGARIVLTFAPVENTPTGPARVPVKTEKTDPKQKGIAPDADPAKDKPTPQPKKQETGAEPEEDTVNVAEQWALDFRRTATEADAKSDAKRQRERRFPAVPARGPAGGDESLTTALAGEPPISWHSAADFVLPKNEEHPQKSAGPSPPADAWRALLLRDERPVLVERRYPESGGSIVFASDSFFLSNEALRTERHPALLAWLVGGSATQRILFDEAHLRLREDPGLMTLARRYRLGGVLAALALLAALFIWKSIASLAPHRAESDAATIADGITGRAATAGFSSLLRRGVSSAELLEVCVARWEAAQAGRAITSASGGHGRVSAEKVERLRALAAAERAKPARARSPATAYRAMCEVLKRTG